MWSAIGLLCTASSLQERVNPEFEVMFETGVDEMSWDDTVRCYANSKPPL